MLRNAKVAAFPDTQGKDEVLRFAAFKEDIRIVAETPQP